MKNTFGNLPIRLKLNAAIVAASFLVLFVFSSVLILVELYSFRNEMVDDITLVADLLGTNAKPALMQNNNDDARIILESLKDQPGIRLSYLFDIAGNPLAQYLDLSDVEFVQKAIHRDFDALAPTFWRDHQDKKVNFDFHSLSLFAPVYHQGEKVGTIYLLSDITDLFQRVHGLIFGILLAVGLLIPFSVVISRFLTRPIAEPLLALSRKMTMISQKSDFSIRAEKKNSDEVGELVDGFNRMLSQIELRDQQLSDHRKDLEVTVAIRTEELRDTVSKLANAKEMAEAANQAKTQFLANMTHELRTPLIGVLGMNELLSRTDLNEQQKSLVATVHNSGENLLSLISDVLDFSKIEAGLMTLEHLDVDIHKAVEETTLLLSERAFAKGLSLVCQVKPAAMWKVSTDPVRIRQILLNLIGNAVKFTAQGEIHVSLDMNMSRRGLGSFVIEVKDTGVGMNAETQETVFSAFVQADSSTTRKYGGTGLGLAIVRNLVDLMGGKIGFESREGQGTVFRIELPLPLVSNQFPQLPTSLRGRRILLYDENANERLVIKDMLSALGLQVVETSQVEDALYRLLADRRQACPFDFAVISSGAVLPDGKNLLGTIEGDSRLSGLRVIGLCSRRSMLTMASGQSDLLLLEKPVSWSNLTMLLARSWNKIGLVSSSVAPGRGAENPQSSEPKQLPGVSTGRILLADDNAVTRELVCLSLVKFNLEIDEVKSGLEVLSALKSKSYDLILMDCNMPELDGIETTRRLREQGCQVPVITLTAHSDQRIFDSCKEAGMNELLRKPFRQKDLHALIEKWLPVKGSVAETQRDSGAAATGEDV